ncbi:MAG: hypothetical protein WAM77_26010 [Xanthobacteraceae bacterium]
MLLTVEKAMIRVLDCWVNLPSPLQEDVDQFRVQLGAAIDSVECVKRALDTYAPEGDREEGAA